MTKDSGNTDARQRSIWLIAAAALVPLLLFVVFQIGFNAREQRREIEAEAASKAEQLIAAADGQAARIAIVVEVLATSVSTRDADWPRLATRFAELAALNPDFKALEVRDGAGRLLLHSGPKIGQVTLIADGRNASRPRFVGYARAGGCRCLIFQEASADRKGNKLVLTLLTDSDIFLKLLPPSGRAFEVAAFNGPEGRFIARSLDSARRFGNPGSTYLQRAVHSDRMAGAYRGFTLEGFRNYTAFARSPTTGWTAHVAFSSHYIDEPVRQFVASLAVAGLLSFLAAALLIAFAVRQLNAARQVTERLQQAQKLEALGQLTGGIAHDFNNLLTPIVAVLDQLRRRESIDERGRMLAAGALASAERAAKLTGQLLTFSRRQQLQIAPVGIASLVSDLVALVERAFGSDHRFEVSVDERAGYVASDRNQLELALLNLALNARDASPKGAVVALTISTVESERGDVAPGMLFRMTDHGAGMDAHTRQRALEPFFTTKPVGRGTGLGLAQVLGVVEQSGGTIEIESEPGSGTTVSIRLPGCAAPAADLQEPTPAPVEEATLLRLLVVDDDPAVRASTARLLEAVGHSVDSVSRGETALAALAAEPFDLLIVDFAMPGMNGAELLARARALRGDVRALVISGFSDSEALAASGVDAPLLAKPFSSQQLLDAVRHIVSAPRVGRGDR